MKCDLIYCNEESSARYYSRGLHPWDRRFRQSPKSTWRELPAHQTCPGISSQL